MNQNNSKSLVPKVQHTPQEFAEAYNKLCQEYGYALVADPIFLPTNHGTFELATEIRTMPINK